ncbi:uncharacterized protein TNCV_2470761 [Trichonephila clavipes]|nr:uncharacterized protein TNCV_2470761 [Trichonephila clavipes]
MPNSSSQMIQDMPYWRQIWGLGRRCTRGNTCGCKKSCAYHWAFMLPPINSRGDRVLPAMTPHILTPAVGVVQFPLAQHHSKRWCRWVGVKGSTRNGPRDPKCPSARPLRMVREDTGASIEGAQGSLVLHVPG